MHFFYYSKLAAILQFLVMIFLFSRGFSAVDDSTTDHKSLPELLRIEKPIDITADISDTVVLSSVRFMVLKETSVNAASARSDPKIASTVHVWIDKPTCGCINVSLDQDKFQPGEGGRLFVRFEVRQTHGLQVIDLTVHAARVDAPAQEQIEHVQVRISVPTVIEADPQHLEWSAAEDHVIKTMTFTAAPGGVLTKYEVSDPSFEVIPERCIRTPTQVTLAFRPVVTDRRTVCTVHMHADVGGGHDRERMGFLAYTPRDKQ